MVQPPAFDDFRHSPLPGPTRELGLAHRSAVRYRAKAATAVHAAPPNMHDTPLARLSSNSLQSLLAVEGSAAWLCLHMPDIVCHAHHCPEQSRQLGDRTVIDFAYRDFHLIHAYDNRPHHHTRVLLEKPRHK